MSIYSTLLLILLAPYLAFAQSTATNPAISVNSLFLARAGTDGTSEESEAPDGISIQEVELRYTSNIDPYFRGEFTLAIHPEHSHHPETGEDGEEEEHDEGGHGYTIEPEEAFIETLQVPHVTFRVGKFYAFFGKHNQLHTHSFPFVDAPLPHSSILGEEGFNEVGVSAAYLLPTNWYSELIVQAFSASESELFGSEDPSDLTGVAYFRNLWDLSEATTLEVGAGYGSGQNAADLKPELYNGTLSVKWRPVELGRYASLEWTTEYLALIPHGHDTTQKVEGASTWLAYQLGRNWWVQGRAELFELEASAENEQSKKYSALLGYIPSEYSALRLQYDTIDHHEENEQRVTLQWNMSMGAHPAHTY